MAAPEWLDELHLEPGPPWLVMGTRTQRYTLFARDENFARDLQWKAELLGTRHGEVFAALDTPEVYAASCEVLALTGGLPDPSLHPLDAAGRRVQEDLCVLVLRDGGPHLDAASLCFPSYWRLADKLGLSLAEVHGAVPHYAQELAARVDGFVGRLRPGQAVWRRNWSIHDDPTYFLPEAAGPGGDELFLRSERQVLRSLTAANAVLFTIRTQQVPLACVAEQPGLARRMADAIDAWSTDLVVYKGGHGARRAREWLRSQS